MPTGSRSAGTRSRIPLDRLGIPFGILYRDERAPKFCAQRAVPRQICTQRLYDSLSVLPAIATVLLRDPLFGDKGRGVMAPGL